MNTVEIAKMLMKLREVVPTAPDVQVGELSEVFAHSAFRDGSVDTKRSMMLQSSESKYRSEIDYPWDSYFGRPLQPLLEGASALDLGCFNGGRAVAWYERYKLAKITGIDVDQVYIDAATLFAQTKACNTDFRVAKGERLPFPDDSFDAVLSFDVFEHVQNVASTLDEVFRVLRPGGRLYVVFPGYFQPVEHHLGLVTRTPGLQFFLSGGTLVKAYVAILRERGAAAAWYARRSPDLEPWERSHTLNGTTYRKFSRLIEQSSWKVVMQSKKPIGSIGRYATKSSFLRVVSRLFYPMVFVPGLREFALHRITYVLEKPVR